MGNNAGEWFATLRDRVVANDIPHKRDYYAERDRDRSQWGEWTFEVIEFRTRPGGPVLFVELRATRTAGAGKGARLDTASYPSLVAARKRLLWAIETLCGYIRTEGGVTRTIFDEKFRADLNGSEAPICERTDRGED